MTEIETPGGPMPIFEAEPEGEPRGAVVVVQEAFGLTTHIEEVARRLAREGWHAVAPALFHRQGSPVLSYDDFAAVMPVMQPADRGAASGRTSRRPRPPRGGRASARAARGSSGSAWAAASPSTPPPSGPLGAAVTFYGGGVTQGRFGFPPLVDLAPGLRTPWLGLYGDLDQSIPPDAVEQLRAGGGHRPRSRPR